ncbi:hypothetical protein VTO42DRAFT_4492 [Malbranchea cinnamomea]
MRETGISGHTWAPPTSEQYSFKAHKFLPCKGNLVLDNSVPAAGSVDAVEIQDSVLNGNEYVGPLSLPLTPPSLPRDSRGDVLHSAVETAASPHEEVTRNATPTRQVNTLTPDVTPPRAVTLLRKSQGQNHLQPSMSSRADSFTTAKEAVSSDEDAEHRSAPNPATLRPPKRRPHRPLRSNSVIDSGASSTAGSGNSTPQKDALGKTEPRNFDSFDGEWITRQRETHPGQEKETGKLPNERPTRNGEPRGPPLRRAQDIRERVRATQLADSDPNVQKSAEDIGWSALDGKQERLMEADNRRLSGTSITSTIEAIIVDTLPQKRRALRHVRKNESLRSASSPIPQPNTNTAAMPDDARAQRHLSHKSARLSNQDRWSVLSDKSLNPSVVSHRRQPTEEVIPVVVIPERRSSLKSTACSTRDQSQTRSIKSMKRPTTAPDGATGAFDVPQRRRRTMSESPRRDRLSINRKGSVTAPVIPPRRSSLSAPTSRNPSRAVSMTSNTPAFDPNVADVTSPVKNEDVQESSTAPIIALNTRDISQKASAATQEAGEDAYAFPHVPNDNAGNHSALLPPLTPFQPSIHSISPGPVEIREAKAVPFFAHNNKSILVVEPGAPASSRMQQPSHDKSPKSNTDEAQTPPTGASVAVVESPLRNPRPPPKPPATAPMGEESNSNGYVSSAKPADTGIGGSRWGSIRRAVSLQRKSELSSAAVATHRARNPKAGRYVDSKRLSFWRPKPFWDDVKDSDTDDCTLPRTQNAATNVQRDDNNDGTVVGNSLGFPQSRALFQGRVSFLRHVSSRARARNARQGNTSHVSLANSVFSRRSRRDRHYLVPGLGLLYPLRNLREWLNQARRQREEEKLEARRNRLRKKIGARVLIEDNPAISAIEAKNV